MLKTLDILIGATTVVLIFSMAVTVITQALTTMAGRRGRHLRAGLADLLQQLGIPERDVAIKISQAVLTHPLFSEGKSWWGGGRPRLGTVISREDFTRILLDAAAAFEPASSTTVSAAPAVAVPATPAPPAGALPPAPALPPSTSVPLAPSTLWKNLDEAAGKQLVEMLQANGISKPAETLKNVRALALQLEVNNPELASDVRQSLALMQEAKSDYVARVNSWFDQTIDRVGQRFTKYTHYVTLAIATLVVLAVQLDMIAVIDRLSVDDHFREKVVNSAIDNFQAQSPKDDKQNGAKDKNSVSTKTSSEAARNGAAAGTTPDVATAHPSSAGTNNNRTVAGASPGVPDSKPATGSDTAAAAPVTTGTSTALAASSASDTTQPAAKATPSPTLANASAVNEKSNAGSAVMQADSEKIMNAGGNTPTRASDIPKVNLNNYYNDLSGAGLIASPLGYDWMAQWSPRKVPGMLIAILLVSLGAPFWYNILKDLLGLRSTLAQKDDAQRTIRQTTQDVQPSVTAITTEVAAVAPAWLKGERGDLGATG